MNFIVKATKSRILKTELMVLFAFEGKKPRLPANVTLLPHPLKCFSGKEHEIRSTDAASGPAERVLLIGLGSKNTADLETIRRAAALAVKKAEQTAVEALTFWIDPTLPPPFGGEALFAQALAEGAFMGAYSFKQLRREPESPALKKITCHADGEDFKAAAQVGCIIGDSNGFTRNLQDMPGNLMRPRDMVKAAESLAEDQELIQLNVLDEKAMKKLGMGSLLSVSRGSSEPAYLIHLRYKPAVKSKRKICLVGKGLTFDAGGISLKPSAKMDEMKYDMSGGAAVLGVFHALASGLTPDAEIHGLIPTSENLPDGKANKPGDLVTAMNRLTIEVLNTDAEGRLILADALAYAEKKIKPTAIIDLATLTGAVVVALGHEYTGAMGNNQELIDDILHAGDRSGERVWQLPLTDLHKDMMKGTVGDLKNINTEGAGSSAGGAFLAHFVGKTPWVHLDIAGTAWGAKDRDYQGGVQGTGVGTRLLLEYIRSKNEISKVK
jgi:leucyl aminopeptidase